MSAVPGPAARLWRDRPRLVAVGLLAVAVVAASLLQTTSATVLQQTLDQNWRGTYDILVTQGGKDPTTSGLLRADALVDATVGRLSMADLAKIRALPGVEVAAPIGEVTFPGGLNPAADARLWVPVPVRASASLENPQAFRVTITSSIDDGVAPKALATQTVQAFAYQPSYSQIVFGPTGAPLVGPDGQTVYATHDLADSPRLLSADSRVAFSAGAYDPSSGTIPLGIYVDPRPAANIALVDPVAERALLGDAGSFLDPLIEASPEAGEVPVLVEDRKSTPITTTVTVEEFDSVTPGVGGALAVEQAQGNGFLQNGQIAPQIVDVGATTVVGKYETDVAPAVGPFTDDLDLLGGVTPSQAEAAGARTPGVGVPRSILSGLYSVPDTARADGSGVRLAARGYDVLDGYVAAPVSAGAPHGAVTDYARLYGAVSESPIAVGKFRIVGRYDLGAVRAAVGETSFAPLGGYDTVNPSLVADASGAAITPKPLAASISGFGIPGTNATAVASFDILKPWNVERPISAIRIRVAGITDYTPAAQQKLLAAASALGSLGYTATIVAGSSPQKLPVLVTGYATAATDGRGAQVIGDLGYIEQDWSRLGAVTDVDAAISATSVALLVVSVVAVGLLLAAVQLASVPARRATAGVLRQLGWRRGRIVGWNLSAEAVALLGLLLVGVIAVLLSSVQAVAAVAVAIAVGLVVVTSLAAVLAGSRAPRMTARRRRARAASRAAKITSPITFGIRLARTQLAPSVSLGLAVLLLTVSVAVAATVFVQGRQLSGPTLLGAVASARSWVPQGLLAAVTLGSGILLAVLARRMGVERRRDQWIAVRAMGWSHAEVTRAHLAELAVSAVPGALLGIAGAAAVAVQLPGLLLPVVAVSAVGALAAIAVVLMFGRKLD